MLFISYYGTKKKHKKKTEIHGPPQQKKTFAHIICPKVVAQVYEFYCHIRNTLIQNEVYETEIYQITAIHVIQEKCITYFSKEALDCR